MPADINKLMEQSLREMTKNLPPNQRKEVLKMFDGSGTNGTPQNDSLPPHLQRAKEAHDKAEQARRTRESHENAVTDAEKIISPQGQEILRKHYAREDGDRTAIEQMAIRRKIQRDWEQGGHTAKLTPLLISQQMGKFKKDDSISDEKGPSLRNLAIVEYYLEKEQKQDIVKSSTNKPGTAAGKSGGAYGKLAPSDKMAVTLAALRAYDQAHEGGNIRAIHGDRAQQEFDRFRNPHTPHTNPLGKDNYPGMQEVLRAVEMARVKRVPVPDGLPGNLGNRYLADGMHKPDFSLDRRYEQHKEEYMQHLRKNPPNPAMADKWINAEREKIAGNPNFLQGARDFSRRANQAGTPDPDVVSGGSDWCKGVNATNGLPTYFQKSNQTMRCP